ncbi:RICIN domain-containing protein [Streptomyces sp. NPDC001219]
MSYDPMHGDWSKLAPTWMIKDEPNLSIDSTPDGLFNLRSKFGGCLAEQSDTHVSLPSTCPTSGTWTLQPANDGSNYFLIRHAGDNKCLTQFDLKNTGAVELSTCDGGNTKQQWSITTSDGSPPPAPSNGAAINLGENKIQVCNWGGYSARATIDYKVKADASSDTETSGHYAIESFPVDQCRTATLPAGKISATVTLRRLTLYNKADYKFDDSLGSSFAGSGDNDKITAVWILGGPHVNAKYHMYGTTCNSSSSFEQESDSQVFSTKQSDQQSCTSNISASDVGTIVSTAWTALTSLFRFF